MRMRTLILSCRRGTVDMVSRNCSGGLRSSGRPVNCWHAFSSSSFGAICAQAGRQDTCRDYSDVQIAPLLDAARDDGCDKMRYKLQSKFVDSCVACLHADNSRCQRMAPDVIRLVGKHAADNNF